jgi:hypothetical protein
VEGGDTEVHPEDLRLINQDVKQQATLEIFGYKYCNQGLGRASRTFDTRISCDVYANNITSSNYRDLFGLPRSSD